MTTADANAEMQACHETAGMLAATAVAPELAVAAADPEIGQPLMLQCLAQSLAANHRAMLRLTAAANGLLDFSIAAEDPTRAELSAARLSGSCGRVMEEVRLGVLALDRLRPEPALSPWHALGWLDGELSEAERERRLAAARAAQAAPQAANDSTPALSAVARERLAAAEAAAAKLTAEANVAELSVRTDLVFLRQLFGHEMAAGHALGMRLHGAADRAFDRAAAASGDTLNAERLVLSAVRMTGRVRRGLLSRTMLSTPRNGGGHRASPVPAPTSPANEPAPVATQKRYATPDQARGKLANGNPSGDYQSAPRCGACTRAGTTCRQPAMANGRCRFHGGKSTGPKTAAGLARSRAARRTHGGYSAEIIDLQKYAAQQARRLREIRLLASLPRAWAGEGRGGGIPAGHGVDPHRNRRSRGRLAFQPPPAASTTAA